MNLFDDKILADAVLALGIGRFEKGQGAPDAYRLGGNTHPLKWFVRSPHVAMELLRLVLARQWAIHPMVTPLNEFQCMIIKVQGVLRSPYVSHNLERAMIMACVDALTEDQRDAKDSTNGTD